MRSLIRTFRFLSPYRWLITGTIVTTILPVMMELTVPRFMRVVIDDGILQSDFQAVWEGALVMFLAAAVGAVATFGQGVFRARLSQALAFDIRNELFAKVMQLSHPDVDQLKTGQLITRLTSDVDVVRMFSSVGISLALRAALMVIGSMIMLVLSDVRLSLIAWVMLLLTAVVLRWVFVKATPLYAIVQARLAALNVVVQENLSGISDANEALVVQNIKVGRLIAVSMPLIALFTNFGLVGLAWFGGSAVIAEDISLGQLVAFNSYLMVGLTPLLLLSGMLAMFSRATASSVRIWEILDTEPVVKPPALPPARDLAGRLEFRNVDFAYTRFGQAAPNGTANGVYASGRGRRAGEKVLAGLDFTIEAGQTIGLIGATGSGKSTLMYLIPRFYDVQAGSILIDGIDVRDWDLKSLRRAVGLVAQHPALFNRSIHDNIAFGNPDLPAEDVLQVARMAQADGFIEARDDGLAHMVEEAGANLSGGQKQRLAIARALAVDPRILLLDDATSSVDLETEAEIQAAFRDAARGRTTIIIAHRVTSIIDADRILILDEGRVVADGTHAELLSASPIYRELYDSQLG